MVKGLLIGLPLPASALGLLPPLLSTKLEVEDLSPNAFFILLAAAEVRERWSGGVAPPAEDGEGEGEEECEEGELALERLERGFPEEDSVHGRSLFLASDQHIFSGCLYEDPEHQEVALKSVNRDALEEKAVVSLAKGCCLYSTNSPSSSCFCTYENKGKRFSLKSEIWEEHRRHVLIYYDHRKNKHV